MLATLQRALRDRLCGVAFTAEVGFAVPTRNICPTREATQGYARLRNATCFYNNFPPQKMLLKGMPILACLVDNGWMGTHGG